MSGTPVLEPDGFVNRDWWQNPSGEIHVAAFEASPEYADTPTGSDTITSLRINDWDAPWFNDFGDNFGQRVTGYLVPDESGPHRFWIAADDVASFRLSRDADPANLVEVASVPAATGGVEFNKYASQKSALIDLVAGQSYALEIVHREGYGGDNAGVWWRKPSHGDHTAPAEAVPSAVLSSVPVGEASTDPAVSIAGADSTTVGDSYTITLSSENTSVTGWTIDWGDGTIDSFGDVSAAAHTYAAVSGSEPLTIVATASTADGTLAADPVSLAVNAPTVTAVEGDGQVFRDYWDNIYGSPTVSSVTADSRYPNNPTGSDLLESLEAVNWNDSTQTANWGDNYGQRIHGYLIAPESGEYTFWINSDDQSRFSLSTDSEPANLSQLAAVEGFTAQGEWNKLPGQRSIAVSLVAGQSYAFEVVHREGAGGDHLAVGWRRPSDGAGESPAEIIPGSSLSTYPVEGESTASTASITGPDIATVGSPYTLSLATTGAAATGWAIDWGDGTTSNVGPVSSATHTYDTAAARSITATAITGQGAVNAGPLAVSVAAEAAFDPTLVLTPGGSSAAGRTFILTATIDSPDTFPIGWEIDWGDGNIETFDLDYVFATTRYEDVAGKTYQEVSADFGHAYAQAGSYDIAVTLIDSSNRVATSDPINVEITAAPALLSLAGTVRDFRSSHPDFENDDAQVPDRRAQRDLVEATLGPDGLPVFNAATTQNSIQSAATFDQWFRDGDASQTISSTLELNETAPGSGIYEFRDLTFFPIDGRGFSVDPAAPEAETFSPIDEAEHNYHFTFELHNQFTYRGGETFEFFGDDDLWVFIDGQRVIDLGGLHEAQGESVSLDTLGLTVGETYDFDLFFAERHRIASRFEMQTSIVFDEAAPPAVNVTLVEDADLITTDASETGGKVATITVPENADHLRVDYRELVFDAASNADRGDVNDAFELVVRRADGSALATIGSPAPVGPPTGERALPELEAQFSLSQGRDALTAPGTTHAPTDAFSGSIFVDISGLPAGEELILTARLLNNDADNTSRVTIDFLTDAPGQGSFAAPTAATPTLFATADADDSRFGVAYSRLDDVSSAFDVAYAGTTYDSEAERLYIATDLVLAGSTALRDDLLIAVTNVRDQATGQDSSAQLASFDGVLSRPVGGLSAGTPYLRLSSLLEQDAAGFFARGASVENLLLTFESVQANKRFDFDLVVLGQPNEAPAFTSDPYAIQQGQAYPVTLTEATGQPRQVLEIVRNENENVFTYAAAAADPNGDRVFYDVVTGPRDLTIDRETGEVSWQPLDGDAGVHQIRLRATDEFGAFDPAADQLLTLHVVENVANRAPQFTSDPVTTAEAGEPYTYFATAFDPDGDDVTFSAVAQFLEAGGEVSEFAADLSIDPDTGQLSWQVPQRVALDVLRVAIVAEDPSGAASEQRYEIAITKEAEATAEVDLAVVSVDASAVQVNPQTLEAEGVVFAEIDNLLPGSVNASFDVTFFADLNFDGLYTSSVDLSLATHRHVGVLHGATSVAVVIDPQQVAFAGVPIYAKVDSGDEINETEETNNVLSSSHDCLVVPDIGDIDPVFEWSYEVPAGFLSAPIVADFDADGRAEIASIDEDGYVHIVDGETGELIHRSTEQFLPYSSLAAGDLIDNGDGKLELVAATNNGVAILDERAVVLSETEGRNPNEGFPHHAAISLANLDGAGAPEIIAGSDVYNIQGERLWSQIRSGYQGDHLRLFEFDIVASSSTVADLNGDGTLEVIAGSAVFEHDGTEALWWTNEVREFLIENDDPFAGDGFTAVADFDFDGIPEVVLVSLGNVYLLSDTGELLWETPYRIPNRGSYGGTPTIADFTGDGQLEIGVAGRTNYVVIDAQGNEVWRAATQDFTSEVTGSSVFDFNGDGAFEVLYADEKDLWIFNGTNGAVLDQIPIGNGTIIELPVVADVDGDGEAEIVVVGDANLDAENARPGIHVLGDANHSWVGTRAIWNQQSYHVTNVNDDGTIPLLETPSWLVNNTYRANVNADVGGQKAPDLIPSFVRQAASAEGQEYAVRVGNGGSQAALAGVSVAFYEGDPSAGGTLLGVADTTDSIAIGSYEDVRFLVESGEVTNLWVVVDDDGSGQGHVLECNEFNNAYSLEEASVSPLVRNRAPVVTQEPSFLAVVGQEYTGQVRAEDPDGDAVVFEIADGPEGLSINSASGLISWQPTPDQVGPSTVVVQVRDGRGGVGTETFDLRVVTPNQAPEIRSTAPTSAKVGVEYRYQVEAFDSNGDTLHYRVDDVSVDRGIEIDQDGLLTWSPSATGVALIGVFVEDRRGGVADELFNLRVGDASSNIPPRITSELEGVIFANETFVYQAVAEDAEDGSSPAAGLRFSLDEASLDRGMRIDAQTGVVEWFPGVIGTFRSLVTVTDSNGASDTQVLTLPVNTRPATNQPAGFQSSPNGPAVANGEWSYLVETSDPEGDNVTIEIVNAPDWLHQSVSDTFQNSVRLSGTPTQGGTFSFELRASDPQDAGETQAFELLALSNAPPVILQAVQSADARVGVPAAYEVVARDPNPGDLLTFELVSGAGAASDGFGAVTRLGENEGSGPGAWSSTLLFTPSNEGVQDVVIRVSDGTASAVHVMTLEVFGEIDLPLSASLTARSSAAVGQLFVAQVEASGSNGEALAFSLDQASIDRGMTIDTLTGRVAWTPTREDLTPAGGQPHAYSATVTATAADGSTRSVTVGPAELTVVSRLTNQPPAFATEPFLVRERGGNSLVYEARANDPDGDPLVYTLESGPAGASIDPESGRFVWHPGESVRPGEVFLARIAANDPYGGIATQQFELRISAGNAAPRITSLPPQPGYGGERYEYLVTATDADNDAIAFSLEGQRDGVSITQVSNTTARVVWANPVDADTRAFEVVVTDARGLEDRQGVNLTIGTIGSGEPGDPGAPGTRPTVDVPPTIVSTPGRTVVEGQEYRYRVIAEDDDATTADPIVYGLLPGHPDWLSIDETTGVLSGTAPAAEPGADPPYLTVTATQAGATALQGYTLQVTSNALDSEGNPVNNPPVVEPAEILIAFAGASFSFDVTARDPEGDVLSYALVDAAGDPLVSDGGFAIDQVTGRVTRELSSDTDPGNMTFRVQARDTSGASSNIQTFNVEIKAPGDDLAPSVGLRANTNVVEAGRSVAFVVDAADDLGLAEVYVEVTAPSLAAPVRLDLGSGGGLVRYTPDEALAGEALTVTAFAVDTSGNVSEAGPLAVSVVGQNQNGPQLRVTNVYPGHAIETSTELEGAIFDTDGNLVYYSLTLKNSQGDVVRREETGVFGGGVGDIIANLGGPGDADVTGLISLNPLSLANGEYTLELLAQDAAGSTASAVLPLTIQVDNEVKLGNFALSFTDLSINVGGIPLTATRSYDTLDSSESLDFGHGWQLDIATGGLTVVDPYSTSLSNEFPAFGEGLRANSRVEVELPGGEKLGFTVTPVSFDKGTPAGGILGLAGFTAFGFAPDREDVGNLLEFEFGEGFELSAENREAWGVDDILRQPDRADDFLRTISGILTPEGGLNAPLTGSQNAGDFGIPADATRLGAFRVTTQEGTKYRFDQRTGQLLSVEDAQGNTVTYGQDIVSTNSEGEETARLDITRDNQGRITRIADASGDDETVQVSYAYDALGNLASVTDRSGRVTTLQYGEEAFSDIDPTAPYEIGEHILTSVTAYPEFASGDNVDALDRTRDGVDSLQVAFDRNGLLAGITDASGASAGFDYTLSGEAVGLSASDTIESVTDADGFTTEVVRDGEGNTLRTIQQVEASTYLVTVFEYDANGNQTSSYQPFEATGAGNERFTAAPAVALARSTYDRFDRVLSSTDAFDQSTRYTYDGRGNLRTVTDADGNVTNSSFNRFNQLTRSVDASGNATEYAYDRTGNLTRLTQFDGAREITASSFVYDGKGRLIRTTGIDPDGVGPQEGITRFFAYNAFGDQVQSWFENADGVIELTQTRYDGEGRVVGTSFLLDGEVAPAGQAVVRNANEVWSTSTEYDGLGRAIVSTDRFGNRTATFYDARGNVVESRSETKDEAGATVYVTTRTAYDANGRAIASTDPFLLSASGVRVTPQADLRVTHTLYDGAGRVTETRRVAGVAITGSVSSEGGRLRDTDFAGSSTDAGVAYDASDILSRSLARYDDAGRVVETETTEGLVTRFAYDAGGRQSSVTIDPQNTFGLEATTRYTYDALGRQATVTDSLDRVTSFAYDSLGRVTATRAEGNDGDAGTDLLTRTVYDDRGRRVAEIDALGRRTDFAYDDAGRLTGVTLPGVDDAETGDPALVRPSWTYGYDSFGNRTSITDPLGRQTAFGFDAQNRETSRTLPLGTATPEAGDFEESRTYFDDASDGALFGLLKSSTDFEGNTVTYGYDAFGRQNVQTYAAADGAVQRTVTTTFDGLGRVTRVVDSEIGTTSHVYDAEGRLLIRATPQGTLTYTYDQATGRQTSVSTGTPGDIGTSTRYEHDVLGRLTAVVGTVQNGEATNQRTEYVYNVGNELVSKTTTRNDASASGVTTAYAYDSLGRLASLVATDASGGLVFSQTQITHDAAGNRTSLLETVTLADGSTAVARLSWAYDGLNRLVRETRDVNDDGVQNQTEADAFGPDYTDTFAFDLNSNRIAYERDLVGTADDLTVASTFDANDRLLVEDSSDDAEDTTYTYDLNGSQLTKTADGETITYRWDALNRLVGVDQDGNGSFEITYTYDANGVRVTQTVDGVTTTYLHDGSNPTGYSKPIEEIVDGQIDRSYVVGLVVESQFDHENGTHAFVHDAHGSTRAILDAITAEVVQRLAYDAFGETLTGAALTEADAALTTWLFAGDGSRDVATGLTYHLERYRRGNVFVSTDPYRGSTGNPLTLHHRGYVHQSPTGNFDPSGNFSVSDVSVTQSIQTVLAAFKIPVTRRGLALGTAFVGTAGLFLYTRFGLSTDVLRDPYKTYIEQAAAANDLEPEVVAAIIVAEQNDLNFRDLGDTIGARFGRNSSIGLGQVNIQTALDHNLVGTQDRSQAISLLNDPKRNIDAVARYIRIIADAAGPAGLAAGQTSVLGVNLTDYSRPGSDWNYSNPNTLILLGSEYTSTPWDFNPVRPGSTRGQLDIFANWGNDVLDAHSRIEQAGIF